MPQYQYTIGPKKLGNYRIPIDFNITFDQDELFDLNIILSGRKTLNLPKGLTLIKGHEPQTELIGGPHCKMLYDIVLDYVYHRRVIPIQTPNGRKWKITLSNIVCHGECTDRDRCKEYISWTVNYEDQSNIYNTIETILNNLATLIIQIWQQAVEKARQSSAFEENKVTRYFYFDNNSQVVISNTVESENAASTSTKSQRLRKLQIS